MTDRRDLDELVRTYVRAWNDRDATAVASAFAPDAVFIINRGEPHSGRAAVEDMAKGFFQDVPDLVLTTEVLRPAGDHALHAWSFTGHHAQTANPLDVPGWEEWDLGSDGLITRSLGWYDAEAYARQIAGG